MAKKRNSRRRGRGGFFSAVFSSIQDFFGFTARVIPGLVITAGMAGVFLGARNLLYADPHLAVREIKVEPAQALTNGRLSQLESRWMGKNILTVDMKAISRDLQKSPYIKTANVTRQMPSRLKINLSNRNPVAFLKLTPRGKSGVIAEDGMILEVLESANASLPVMEVFGGMDRDLRIGYFFKHTGLSESVRFLAAFSRHPLARQETLTRISLDPLGNVTAVLGSGPDIKLGRYPADRLATLEKMIHLLESGDRPKIEYIDLQFDNVIVKRKS